jgi:hypothetical protein
LAKRPRRSASGTADDVHLLLASYKHANDWDEYFNILLSPQAQDHLAAEAARAGAAGPLEELQSGLGQAVRLLRIGDAVAVALATARWSRRLSVTAAPGADPAVEPDVTGGAGAADEALGGTAELNLRTGRDVLRALLRAWERYEAGYRSTARSLLGAIERGRPPLIHASDDARWAVPLLRAAFVIDPGITARLLSIRIVDDNVLGDLARELTAAGEYSRARIAGAAMGLFHETKADVLADLALAQAEAALRQGTATRRDTAGVSPREPPSPAGLRAAAETANLATEAARQALAEGPDATMAPRVPRVAGRLAKAAAALTLSGEQALAAQRWAEAMAVAEQEPDPHRLLADFAQAQVRAGLLDDAAQVIAVLLDESPASVLDLEAITDLDPGWRAAAALVTALAERGDVAGATAVLGMIPDFALSHPQAVRGLVRVLASTDVVQAERLAGQLDNPDEQGRALAAVAGAALAAGRRGDAVRVADGIEHPHWRAQALVDLATAQVRPADLSFDLLRSAIAAVTDAGTGAILLAEYAVTRDSEERRRLVAEAIRLVGEAPPESWWRLTARIGVTAAKAGLAAEAREAFTAAQRLLAPERDDRELCQLCRVRLDAGDTAGARETAGVALSAPAGRTADGRRRSPVGTVIAAFAAAVAGRRRRQLASVAEPALDRAIAATDIPAAVEVLSSIATLAALRSARAVPSAVMAEPDRADGPGLSADQIERVLAAAERLAEPYGMGAISAAESLAGAYTALGDFAAAERWILGLLPDLDDEDDEDEIIPVVARQERGIGLADVAQERSSLAANVAQERSIALADALVAAGESERAATFMREVADRLRPCARWSLGPAATQMLAELAAAQVRTGDIEGARATAAFAATVADPVTSGLPQPLGSPGADETGTVTAVVSAMTALMRESRIEPADFVGAGVPATDYARRPWQARARTLAAVSQALTDPAERARLAAVLAEDQAQIWRLVTATFVRDVTADYGDAAAALAVIAGARAAVGRMMDLLGEARAADELGEARSALARGRELAADIEDPAARARALGEVARGLSAVGDHATAMSVARGIGHPAYKGRAMAAAITAAADAGADAGLMDLLGEARAIEDKGWQAVALAALAAGGTGPLDSAETRPLIEKAYALIDDVPHGAPRTQVWREVINRWVAAGRYDLVVDLADQITDDAEGNLTSIAVALGLHAVSWSPGEEPRRREAGDALLRLLPHCARYPQAVHAACTVLAMAFPADAAVIAGAVAQHAATVQAAANAAEIEAAREAAR